LCALVASMAPCKDARRVGQGTRLTPKCPKGKIWGAKNHIFSLLGCSRACTTLGMVQGGQQVRA